MQELPQSNPVAALEAKKIHNHSIRNTLKSFPYLRDIMEGGFNYKGFCAQIDNSNDLSAKNKENAKALFNPNKRVISAIIRNKPESNINEPEFVSAFDDTHKPIRQLWKNVWYDTKDRYERQVASYDVMIEEKMRKRGKSTEGARYPHIIPNIIISKSNLPNAAIIFEDIPTLMISKGFLSLPYEQQKAVLYHEANHAFEPVLHKIDVGNYALGRLMSNILTVNAASRYNEYKADSNAAAFGHATPLARALNHITESHTPKAMRVIGNMGIVAKAATENGFALDRKKVSGFMVTTTESIGFKQQFLKPVVAIGGFIGTLMLNKVLKNLATKSTEEIFKNSSSGKMWIFRVSSHPPTEKRIGRLL